MSNLHIRDLDPDVVLRLKERARRHRRSLQAEVRFILESASCSLSMADARRVAEASRSRYRASRPDSAGLLHEDRER